MSVPKRIKVICEGKSDFRYIRRLQSFLESEMPYPEGWDSAPIKFLPCPTVADETENAGGVSSGYFDEVEPVYRAEKETCLDNEEVMVWVDADVYIQKVPRKHSDTATMYLSRADDIPVFYFSYHKFEDFVVLHYGAEQLKRWKAIFNPDDSSFDHVHKMPLTNKDYATLYQRLFPYYSKRKLPEDLISKEHLANLRLVYEDPDLQRMKTLFQPGYSFAEFLIAELAAAYPDVEEWQG